MKLWPVLLLGLLPQLSWGVTIGDLLLESGIGEPIKATVNLYNLSGVDPREVDVQAMLVGEEQGISLRTAIAISGNIGWLTVISDDPHMERVVRIKISIIHPGGSYSVKHHGRLTGRLPEIESCPFRGRVVCSK